MPKRIIKRTLSPQFKFQVALEGLKEVRSINEIAAANKVHPSQVTTWKKELREGGSLLFASKGSVPFSVSTTTRFVTTASTQTDSAASNKNATRFCHLFSPAPAAAKPLSLLQSP